MERLDRAGPARAFKRVSARIRELSGRDRAGSLALRLKTLRDRHGKRALGAGMLLTALVLGIWAQDLARAQALSEWLRTHPPSAEAWTHALASAGLVPVSDTRLIGRAARSLPSLVDLEGSVWIAPDSNWVAVFQRRENDSTPALFCHDCGTLPSTWSPAGVGWAAFDLALSTLREAAAARAPLPSPRKRAQPRDPREIVY